MPANDQQRQTLELFSFTTEDKRILLFLIIIVYVLSFVIQSLLFVQVVGLSTSVWLCEENFQCRGILEVDAKIKGPVFAGFALKACGVLFGVSFFVYKYKVADFSDEAWPYCLREFKFKFLWKVLVITTAISEILSGSAFFIASMHYQTSIGWSTYLFAYFSSLMVVVASTMMVVGGMWTILSSLVTNSVIAAQQASSRTQTPGRVSGQVTVTNLELTTNLCGICMERTLEVILPCSHKLCRTCAEEIQSDSSLCPFDRSQFDGFVTIMRR